MLTATRRIPLNCGLPFTAISPSACSTEAGRIAIHVCSPFGGYLPAGPACSFDADSISASAVVAKLAAFIRPSAELDPFGYDPAGTGPITAGWSTSGLANPLVECSAVFRSVAVSLVELDDFDPLEYDPIGGGVMTVLDTALNNDHHVGGATPHPCTIL